MRRMRIRGAGLLGSALVAALIATSASPAAAVNPPRIDPGALIRSAPVAPPEPTEQPGAAAAHAAHQISR